MSLVQKTKCKYCIVLDYSINLSTVSTHCTLTAGKFRLNSRRKNALHIVYLSPGMKVLIANSPSSMWFYPTCDVNFFHMVRWLLSRLCRRNSRSVTWILRSQMLHSEQLFLIEIFTSRRSLDEHTQTFSGVWSIFISDHEVLQIRL